MNPTIRDVCVCVCVRMCVCMRVCGVLYVCMIYVWDIRVPSMYVCHIYS